MDIYKNSYLKLGMMVHIFNPSTGEIETGRSLILRLAKSTEWVPGLSKPVWATGKSCLKEKQQQQKMKYLYLVAIAILYFPLLSPSSILFWWPHDYSVDITNFKNWMLLLNLLFLVFFPLFV